MHNSLFFLEKKSEIWNAFTFFEKWKVKQIFLSLFLRNEKWNDFLFHSFREVKVKLKYLETEIERWNFKKNLENSRETRLSLVTDTRTTLIRGTLRSWGHLSFNYYLVKTDPMLHIFGSKIISLTFLDILNANLSKIETRISHL